MTDPQSQARVVATIDTKVDYQVEKLEQTNFTTWKWQILNVLKAKRLETAIATGQVENHIQQSALALIGSALNEENKMLVVGCQTAIEVWQRLESVYENKTTFEKQELLSQLHSYRITSVANVAKALGEMQTLASKLNLLGETISDDSLMSIILNALPNESFGNFLVAFKLLSPETRTLTHLISNVIARAREIESKTKADEVALLAKKKFSKTNNKSKHTRNGRPKEEVTCYYCKNWVTIRMTAEN